MQSNTTSKPCDASQMFLGILTIVFLGLTIWGMLCLYKDSGYDPILDWVKTPEELAIDFQGGETMQNIAKALSPSTMAFAGTVGLGFMSYFMSSGAFRVAITFSAVCFAMALLLLFASSGNLPFGFTEVFDGLDIPQWAPLACIAGGIGFPGLFIACNVVSGGVNMCFGNKPDPPEIILQTNERRLLSKSLLPEAEIYFASRWYRWVLCSLLLVLLFVFWKARRVAEDLPPRPRVYIVKKQPQFALGPRPMSL